MKQAIFQEHKGPNGSMSLSVVPTPEYQALALQAGTQALKAQLVEREAIYAQFKTDLIALWARQMGSKRFHPLLTRMAELQADTLREGVAEALNAPAGPGDRLS